MRKKHLLPIAFIMVVGTAAGFSASYSFEDRVASPDDAAEISVEVENDGFESRSFQVSVSPYSSWFYVEKPKTLQPGENRTFQLSIQPSEEAVQQNYFFDIVVSDGVQTQRFEDYFTVEQPNDLKFTSVSSDRNSYKPGDKARYSLEVLNTAPEQISDYRVRAELEGERVEKQGLPVSPGSRAAMRLEVPVSNSSSPGEKTVEISVIRDGEKTTSIEQQLKVKKVTDIQKSEETSNRLIIYERRLSATNEGNHRTEAELDVELPSYLEPITSFSREPDRVQETDTGKSYTWTSDLEPGETGSVSYRVNYWIPATVLMAVLGGLVGLKKLNRNLKFSKRARATEKGVTIHIELENRSSTPVRNLEVKDFVPDIASVGDDFPMAKPVVRKTSNGTRLTWEIDELSPGDQRVFEYSIKPLVEVEGEVELPEAELEVEGRKKSETSKVETRFEPEDS